MTTQATHRLARLTALIAASSRKDKPMEDAMGLLCPAPYSEREIRKAVSLCIQADRPELARVWWHKAPAGMAFHPAWRQEVFADDSQRTGAKWVDFLAWLDANHAMHDGTPWTATCVIKGFKAPCTLLNGMLYTMKAKELNTVVPWLLNQGAQVDQESAWISETKLALEVPLGWQFHLLSKRWSARQETAWEKVLSEQVWWQALMQAGLPEVDVECDTAMDEAHISTHLEYLPSRIRNYTYRWGQAWCIRASAQAPVVLAPVRRQRI